MLHNIRDFWVAFLAPLCIAPFSSPLQASESDLNVFAHHLHIEHNEDTLADELTCPRLFGPRIN